MQSLKSFHHLNSDLDYCFNREAVFHVKLHQLFEIVTKHLHYDKGQICIRNCALFDQFWEPFHASQFPQNEHL